MRSRMGKLFAPAGRIWNATVTGGRVWTPTHTHKERASSPAGTGSVEYADSPITAISLDMASGTRNMITTNMTCCQRQVTTRDWLNICHFDSLSKDLETYCKIHEVASATQISAKKQCTLEHKAVRHGDTKGQQVSGFLCPCRYCSRLLRLVSM